MINFKIILLFLQSWTNVFKELNIRVCGEDGGVGESRARFIPQIHLDNIHISLNNPENDPNSGRTNSPQVNVEKRPHQRDSAMWMGANWPAGLLAGGRDAAGMEGEEEQTHTSHPRHAGPKRGRWITQHVALKTRKG